MSGRPGMPASAVVRMETSGMLVQADGLGNTGWKSATGGPAEEQNEDACSVWIPAPLRSGRLRS